MSEETAAVMTAIIASLGFVLSIVSLTWQVISWRYSGSFVKVQNRSKYVIFPKGPEGYILCITARNKGRMPVTVTAWSLAIQGGDALMVAFPEVWQGPALPFRLESGDSTSWFVQETRLLDAMSGRPQKAKVVAQVSLATGKTAVARRRIRRDWVTIDRSETPDLGGE